MHRCWSVFALEILFIICCVVGTLPGANLECAGLDSPLDIFPEGDHIIEYGSALELFCTINPNDTRAKGFDSSGLHFHRFHEYEKIILSNSVVVNETTIKIAIQPPLGSTNIFCGLNSSYLCLTNIIAGYKPQPVLNFQCVSRNWEKLYCHWTPPDNPVKTEYQLRYSLKGRSGGYGKPCPDEQDVKNNSCVYGFETHPPYRQPHQYYYFELTGINVLGNFSKKYTFHHYERMIPDKPENVEIVNKTVGSVLLGWRVPHPINNFPPGLKLKIEYKNKWEDWVEANVPQNWKIYGRNHTCNITGLKYSHTAYDVRVYLKSFMGKVGPEGWSQPAPVTFVTPSTIPSEPPATTQGCFEIVSSGNDTEVLIYWARVSEKFENGDNFTYNVECTKDNSLDCGPPNEKSSSFAKFPINGLHSYKFTIYSVNEVGRSVGSSHVFVNRYENFIQPQSLTKVAYDKGVFELSWKPVSHSDLSNYTIFWCKEEKDLSVPCKGYLDWQTVPKNITSKNITMSDDTKFYKFAIAANLIDGTSSGMVWSSCVIFHDKILKKIDDFRISRFGSREVDVEWEIRCAQSSAIKGFAFYYCPVDFSTQDNKCKDNTTEKMVKLNVSEERNITLHNLKPYTTYKLQISIVSLDGSQQIQLGPRSIAKRFSTLEDAPSVPLNFSASTITNKSVTLTWDLPQEMNGILQTYKLLIKYPGVEREVEFNAQNLTDNSIIRKYEVQNLVSYTPHNFALKACTSIVKCSDYSNHINVTTLVGTPAKMTKPQVSLINASMADISWESPSTPAGALDYYQLEITVDGVSDYNEIFNLTGLRKNLAIKACKVEYNNPPQFRIRAININNNVTYYGPWSNATEVHCGSSVWSEYTVLINWISVTSTLIVITTILICIIKKGWLQCRKMKDVEVKLPPGLQSQDLKETQDYVHLDKWPPRSNDMMNGSIGTVLAPDEESLLDKKSDESMDITSFNMPIKNGGDSSGCSVGLESASSSITSDTHISSDSGAEADQCALKPSPFELWNSANPISKNPNDNIVNLPPKQSVNFPSLEDWDLNEPNIPGYTKVGFGTNSFPPVKSLPDKGYVTIASVTSLNPPTNFSNCSTGGSYSSLSEQEFSTEPDVKNVSVNKPPPKYVSLAHFEGQRMGKSADVLNGDRSMGKDAPTLSRLDEQDDEKTEDSTEEDFSGKETDTETIHEVPITMNLAPMPSYVTMIDNPNRCTVVDVTDDDEDDEEDDETDKEDARLTPEPKDTENKSKASGVENVIVDKLHKENELFSNYIPHHLFGKESVHT